MEAELKARQLELDWEIEWNPGSGILDEFNDG